MGNKSRCMESATDMLIHIKKKSYLERKKMYIDTEEELYQEMMPKNFPNLKRIENFRLKGLQSNKEWRIRNPVLETSWQNVWTEKQREKIGKPLERRVEHHTGKKSDFIKVHLSVE